MNKSGGLLYHYTALKYKKKLWQPYISFISKLLRSSTKKSRKLILIGPSAGYSLDKQWLKQFQKVYVVEKDSFALKLFKFRFSLNNIELLGVDAFSPKVQSKISAILSDHPSTLTVLCNLLGQNICSDARQKTQLLELFKRTPLISYHDYYSTQVQQGKPVTGDTSLAFIESAQSLGCTEVTDHLTSQIFDNTFKKSYVIWELYPRQFHLIETATKV